MTTYDFAHFLDVKRDHGEEISALCPFHEDRSPSFSANVLKGLWVCHAGCGSGTFQTFLARLRGDEVVPSPRAGRPTDSASQCENGWRGFNKVAEYLYLDWKGRELIRLVRWQNDKGQKRFVYKKLRKERSIERSQRARACPYRYELWRNASPGELIFVVEGEKGVDFLFSLGLTATTFLGGSTGWHEGLEQFFRGRKLVVLLDNDLPGKKLGEAVLAGVAAVAADVRLIELPGLSASEDVFDWFSKGGTLVDFKCLISR